ncbi:MAG: aminotransferase class III-fold pyridoxal phosphate-dependent enzyme [Actinomycetia bacterium]|nr:aminotransferase class III-fold pyridoxal phosphate-dependent enzyme [Actinomycetes bacterium]
MSARRLTNTALNERALRRIPGGVNSPVRAFRSVGGAPYFVDRGKGARVWDVEGNEYVDWVQSYGASILGHAHPDVVEAITEVAGRGTTFGAPTEGEVVLAEMLCDRVPGMQEVRLVSSGTEATMSAIRLARGITGRDRIVKFDGNYHGHSDSLLAGAGSGVAEGALLGGAAPDSAGVTPAAVADTTVLAYNVVPDLDDSVAVVVVEPVAANMGLVAPGDGFLDGLRAECDRVGALLLFDEVITGFRLGPGGATERYGVQPDLWCFGKVIGGGMPIGAFGASAAHMEHLAPVGDVYQAGTLSGNPVATAAGATVLSLMDDGAYRRLENTAESLAEGLAAAFAEVGVAARVPRVGSLVGLYFGDGALPTDFAGAADSVGLGRYPEFFHGMLEHGVALAPGPYEVMFPSMAHGETEVAATVYAATEVARRMG